MVRRRLILLAYVAAAAFFLAHMLNAWVSQALTRPAPPVLVGADTGPPGPLSSDSARLADAILSSGVFPVPNRPELRQDPEESAEPSAPRVGALHLDRKLRLIGTVLGEGWSAMAVLEDRRKKEQALFRLHQEIPGAGEIVEIRKDGIVVEAGGVRELLELAVQMPVPAKEKEEPTAAAKFGPVAGTRAAAEPGPQSVASLSPVHKIVDRRVIEESTSDLPKLLSQARAVPHYVNGQIDGWRVVSIKSDSIFGKLGLQKGDILQRVNGVAIKDPGTMLALFQQVKNEDQVSLDLLRQNQRMAMTYEIR